MTEQACLPDQLTSSAADFYQLSSSAVSPSALPMTGAYDPGRLLDYVAHELRVADDIRLADALELPAFLLAKIRHGKRRIGATVFLRMQELTGTPIAALKQRLGERRGRYRLE